ncbi:MAG: methyltransferase [Chlamydiia bacterium]|nr:methyltransferase [Chlamydiia bacterium]
MFGVNGITEAMLYFVATLAVFLIILFLLILFTWKNGVSPTPTTEKMRRALLEHLPEIKEGVVVELGSGWGNLLFPLSKKYAHCKVIGYENSPIPYLFSSLINHTPNIKIYRHDFFEKSLREANLIVCFLFPSGMKRLKEKLERELCSGTYVVSHTYEIPGWEPKETIEVGTSMIYLYEAV